MMIRLYLAASLICILLPPTHAQQNALHAPPPLPSFEVATIKLRNPSDVIHMALPGLSDSNYLAVPAEQLITIAYQVPQFSSQTRVLNAPDWARKTQYIIHTKTPADVFASMQHMTMVGRQRLNSLMLQTLLADRFHLKVHFEKRTEPAYDLIVDKGGPKLTPAANPTDNLNPGTAIGAMGSPVTGGLTPDGTIMLNGRNYTLDALAISLELPAGRAVINRTGISGVFDIKLHYDATDTVFAQFITQPRSPDAVAPPTFFEAIKQLGLKLQPSKAEVEYVVIDHIEEPTEN